MEQSRRRSSGIWLRVAAALMMFSVLAISSTWAKWMRPTEMPVSHLLKNVREYVKAHPRDAKSYYTLGRINSAAFAMLGRYSPVPLAEEKETIGVYGGDQLPSISNRPSAGFNPEPRNTNTPLPSRTVTYRCDRQLQKGV